MMLYEIKEMIWVFAFAMATEPRVVCLLSMCFTTKPHPCSFVSYWFACNIASADLELVLEVKVELIDILSHHPHGSWNHQTELLKERK